jgi:hypothetical protein
MRMPPKPEPIHINETAKDGMERSPCTSAAMSLSATTVIHGAPKATAMITSTTLATIHDVRLSTEGSDDDFSMNVAVLARPAGLWAARV